MKTIIERWVAAKTEYRAAVEAALAVVEEAKARYQREAGQNLPDANDTDGPWYHEDWPNPIRKYFPFLLNSAPKVGDHYYGSLKAIKAETEWYKKVTPELVWFWIQRWEDSRN